MKESASGAINNKRNNSLWKKLTYSKEFPPFIALVILCVVVSLLSPYFLRSKNIFNVLRQISVIGILTIGEALIIIAGGIDLSVGSILGLMGVMTALFARAGLHPVLVFFCVIFVGICVSSINGLLITQIGINPFIATLGMLSIARGTSLLITGGMPLSIDSNGIVFLGSGRWGPVPIPVIIMLIIAVLGFIFSTMMLPGRNVYAIGNNERSARLSGIRVERVRIMTFSIMGALCAISGMITSGTLKTAEPNAGMGYELDAIAAVVIGGTSLSGGEGSIPGAIIGAAILGVLRNSFVLLGVSAYWQVVAIGIVTIAAVSIDSLKSKKAKQ